MSALADPVVPSAPLPERPRATLLAHPHAPWIAAAVLAVLYVVFSPAAGDLPAQTYRTWLFEQEGPSLFDTSWYGGHHLPGYSLAFPPLAALLGVQVVGALAAVVSAWLFSRIAHELVGDDAWLGSLWFGVATASTLLAGRLTFALGVAAALAALLLALHGRWPWAWLLAILTAVSSPVAALFLAMIAAAWWLHERRWGVLVLGAASVAPVLTIAAMFPEGGSQPMLTGTFIRVLLMALAILAVVPRDLPLLRTAAALYVLAIVASFVLDTPMGSNVTRLGTLAAGPVLACVLISRWSARLVVLLALPFLQWQWEAPVYDWYTAWRDPLVEQAAYTDVLAFLDERRAAEGPFRVEVPFTRNHVDADLVARRHPIARGWQRQLDLRLNEVFYEGTLTPARYRAWLEENAVRYVALPDGKLDASARTEAELLRAGRVRDLTEVYAQGRWRVWRVDGPGARRLADRARVLDLGPDRVTLAVPAAGEVLLRVRFTPYWRVVEGDACVARARGPEEWTALRVRRPGRVVLATTFAFGRVRATGARC